jgi:MraZ protein
MFRGQFLHSIDAKGRVSLPARFRDLIAAGSDQRVVLSPSPFDPCLRVYPMAAWERFEVRLSGLSSVQAQAMKFRRMLSGSVDCEIDRAGRVLVPENLRERARLEKEALCVGMGEFVELWSKRDFDDSLEMNADEMRELRVAMEQLGL